MNKIILIFVVFCWSFHSQAQSPTITINCNFGSPCFNPDPFQEVHYETIINDGSYTGWTRVIDWDFEPFGSFFETNTSVENERSVRWENQPNSPSRIVRVTVTYTLGTQQEEFTEETVVTVKYIAPLSSMTVSGGSPSAISNSGGSTTVPCGVSTFTVSVPTPTTDPSTSVNYSWTLPSGWSGSSTSNAITVTTNAGANDGTITARARRSDWNGTFEQTFSVNVNRPRVGTTNISGSNPRLVCTNETKTFTAITTNATSFSWQTSGGVSISGSSTRVLKFGRTLII